MVGACEHSGVHAHMQCWQDKLAYCDTAVSYTRKAFVKLTSGYLLLFILQKSVVAYYLAKGSFK